MKIHVLAQITALPEFKDSVQAALLKMIEPTQKEQGCELYELHQDLENDNLFVMIETWESQESLDLHLASAHMEILKSELDAKISGLQIQRVQRIS